MKDGFAIKTLSELVFSVNEKDDPIDVILSSCLGSVKRVIESVMEAERDIFFLAQSPPVELSYLSWDSTWVYSSLTG